MIRILLCNKISELKNKYVFGKVIFKILVNKLFYREKSKYKQLVSPKTLVSFVFAILCCCFATTIDHKGHGSTILGEPRSREQHLFASYYTVQ